MTEVSSRIELTKKQDLYYITFRFYDKNGNELSLDNGMSITAQSVNESGGIIPIPNIHMQQGEMQSGGFEITEAFEKNEKIDFSLVYFVYIKKSYSVNVPIRNYFVTGIENKKYYGTWIDGEITISIPLKDISDSKRLVSIKLTENGAHNISSVTILDQNIILNIPDKGSFRGEVFIRDSTGMESVILLEGTALTRRSIIVTVAVVFVSLLILIGTILTMQRKPKTHK